MKPKQEPFTPEELEPILNLASECGMILVGGQAVNSWALLLEKPEDEPWKSLRPYTSLDADMLCSEYQMLKFAKTLSDSGWGVQVFRAEGKDKTENTSSSVARRSKPSSRKAAKCPASTDLSPPRRG